jgi:hypothetical protein
VRLLTRVWVAFSVDGVKVAKLNRSIAHQRPRPPRGGNFRTAVI